MLTLCLHYQVDAYMSVRTELTAALTNINKYPHSGYKGAVNIFAFCQCWYDPSSCCIEPVSAVSRDPLILTW